MFIPLGFYLDFERMVDKHDISRTVLELTERINVFDYVEPATGGPHDLYDDLMMLRIVLLGFSEKGYASLRDISEKCKYDIRYMTFTNGLRPSHMTVKRFLDRLKMKVEDIFRDINLEIEEKVDIPTMILCLDGSKFEANANKMSFIWSKNTKRYYARAWKNFIELIGRINLYFEKEGIAVKYSILKSPSIPYMLEIGTRIEKYMEAEGIEQVHGRGKRKSNIQRLYEELRDLANKMVGYNIQLDLLDGRNSCSKTDPDSSFLHMKYDYYNHTNVFKPGYNIQLGVSGGFIRNIYINTDANDLNTFIPFLKKHYEMYGYYPRIVPADAGYGSYDNYKFCKENNIELYMKFPGMHKEKEKVTDRNRYRLRNFRQDDGTYICPEGHEFEKASERTEKRGLYDRLIVTMENSHCGSCPVKSKCTKAKGNRKIRISPELEEMKQEVRDNLSTSVGKELMNARSAMSEGTFGIIKQDQGYDRLRRRMNSNVNLEINLMAIGFNIRKYNTIKRQKAEEEEKKCHMAS